LGLNGKCHISKLCQFVCAYFHIVIEHIQYPPINLRDQDICQFAVIKAERGFDKLGLVFGIGAIRIVVLQRVQPLSLAPFMGYREKSF
jgi:hypothetical protein